MKWTRETHENHSCMPQKLKILQENVYKYIVYTHIVPDRLVSAAHQ